MTMDDRSPMTDPRSTNGEQRDPLNPLISLPENPVNAIPSQPSTFSLQPMGDQAAAPTADVIQPSAFSLQPLGGQPSTPIQPSTLDVLDSIQQRVLWLATNIIHHANNVRAEKDVVKVGGHQASSASLVSILTALYFHFLRAGDRVAVKPHASPAYHAVQYLLGNLDRSYLTTLRAYQGLQAYPSRTKDPDPVDFSTGSVGLGVAAPAFAALADRYARLHFNPDAPARRFIALAGDAELDEGNVWEAVTESHLGDLGNVIWIIDLNRQSLDRVVPGIRARQLKAIFSDSDWHVIEAKYGRRLQAAFAKPGGEALRRRIDEMSNEEYQATIRFDGPTCRTRLIEGADDPEAIRRVLAEMPDEEVPSLLSDLGGHDIAELLLALDEADRETERPSVVFAYTIKGWGLPIAGAPDNHAAVLNRTQVAALAEKLGIDSNDEWARFPAGTPEDQLCLGAAARLREPESARKAIPPDSIPMAIDHAPPPSTSTQETLGRLLIDLTRIPELSGRVVTCAPDVAVSTNLGGWINRVGVYQATTAIDFDDSRMRAVRWQPRPQGQHIELGISEMNMFLLLEALGLSTELFGEPMLPIGTVYDPFVLRGLDAFIHALYSESKFIIAGTPSGISLSPEGGAHQSTVTPSLGLELPNLVSFEPAFARELEWILLDGLRACADRRNGYSTYLRLSTKPIEQRLIDRALERIGSAELRRQVLAGGYRLVDAASDAPDSDPRETVQIAVAGAMVPEAMDAAQRLHREGVAANVLAITSADRLYSQVANARRNQLAGESAVLGHLAELIPPAERRAPMVTVLDGASHALTFLGSVFGVPVIPLGVDQFGQSGRQVDLYHHYRIDADAIVAAAFLALDLRG